MKCPKCGQELKPSKKEPVYMLCFDCKKKFKVSSKTGKNEEQEEEAQRYSNIPPKQVRDKREKEMRKAYTEMLSTEEKGKRKKKARREEYVDDYDYEDEKVSKAPIIILGIAILIVAGLIIYMLLK